MQARTLKIIAALLIIGAVVMGIIGFKISQQDSKRKASAAASNSSASSNEFTYAQKLLIASKPISKGYIITADDVQLIPFPIAIENSFSNTGDIVNKKAERDIQQGAIIRNRDLEKTSALAQHIQPGYRAIAVKVDEVIGAGGFLVPGDHVDIIFSSKATKETYKKSLSRRLIRNVRLLAYGSDIEGKETPAVVVDAKGRVKKTKDKDSGKRSRSAVLEIKEDEINKLVLAEHSGLLKLVAVGEEEMNPSNELADTDELASTNEEPPTIDTPSYIREVTGQKPPARPKTVYVYSGDSVETIRVQK